jgi:hypothetical protein
MYGGGDRSPSMISRSARARSEVGLDRDVGGCGDIDRVLCMIF